MGGWGREVERPPLQAPWPLCGCLCLETPILTLFCGMFQGLKACCRKLCGCQIRRGIPGDMWPWELEGSRRNLETLSSDPEAKVFQNKSCWVKRTRAILSGPRGRCQLSARSVPCIRPRNSECPLCASMCLGASCAGLSRWEALTPWQFQVQRLQRAVSSYR